VKIKIVSVLYVLWYLIVGYLILRTLWYELLLFVS